MTREEYAKLTDEEKRVKVAEHCGIKNIGRYSKYSSLMGELDGRTVMILDYLNDLNACHEFEEFKTIEQHDKYDTLLDSITRKAGIPSWNATAAQRAEAFVLTLEN